MTTLQEVKQRLDIVEVVGQYVALRRSGRNFKALCPFHAEKTPSFYVFPENQTWRCFGACARGGDVISFVMLHDKLSFAEALARLAERAGLPLRQRWSTQEQDRLRRLEACNQAAVEFYHSLLIRSPEAQSTRAYLEQRGVRPESIVLFNLGYSPAGRDLLFTHLSMKGFEEMEIFEAGLALRTEDGSVRDRFRRRLMFPIADEKGRMVGFGARALDPDAQPKYLNTPQAPLFDKGGTLYGANLAAQHTRETGQAVIVEGYMDVVIAHQAGFRGVVASMGTALTDKQVAALKGMGHHFILALDADAAGDEATLRSLEESWDVFNRKAPTRRGEADPSLSRQSGTLAGYRGQPSYVLEVMSLPRGRDPDEVILESPQLWEQLLAQATPLLDYLFEAVARKIDLTTDQGKTAALRKLAPLIARLEHVSAQDRYLQKLSALVGVDRAMLNSAWVSLKREGRAGGKSDLAEVVRPQQKGDALEGYLLRLLYRYPELLGQGKELTQEHFQQTENWELFSALLTHGNPDSAGEHLDPALKELLDALLSRDLPASTAPERERALAQCQARLEERRIRTQKMAERDLLAEGEPPPGQMELAFLYQRALELNKTLRDTQAKQEALG